MNLETADTAKEPVQPIGTPILGETLFTLVVGYGDFLLAGLG